MLQITGAFEWNQFFSDVGCQVIFYIVRLDRSMSISTTCLLSVFQAITISLRNSCWKDPMVKTPRFMGFSVSLCWIPHMLMKMIFPVYLSTKKSSKNITQKRSFEFCLSFPVMKNSESLYTAFVVFPEILLSVLIIWSSSSMVLILYRHKQQVQYIRSIRVSSRISPEFKATHSILILVFTFVGFYDLSSILQGCVVLIYNPSWWLLSITAIISMCFPVLGPFVMSHYATVPRLCYS
ncbi:Vomeronasal type-1 receptor 4 [Lemmus lemmus]